MPGTKKKIFMIALSLFFVLGGAAALGVLQNKILNVAACIDNTNIKVDPNSLDFGKVFPQEYLEKNFIISLSKSFLGDNKSEGIQYSILQKPKCWNNNSLHPKYAEVDEKTGKCPCGYSKMNDLCQFLSETTGDANDTSKPSYFNSQTDSCPSTPPIAASGILTKNGQDTSDNWIVDFKVPPIAGFVAQDWPKNCPTVAKNDQNYGCDLWVQVTDITKPVPVCGNGKKEEGETCDDGNKISGDGCSSICKIEPPVCGNGRLEKDEECDDGNKTSWDGCSSKCKIEPVCGNHKVEKGEQCDDGNKKSGDGCSSTCQKEIKCRDGKFKLSCGK